MVWGGWLWWGGGRVGVGVRCGLSGLKTVKASTASGCMGAMPASGLLVSYIWLGDTFYWIHLVGFAFVLGGIGMVSWAHYRSEKIAQQQGKEYDTYHATPC